MQKKQIKADITGPSEKTEIPSLGFPVLGILPPSGFLVSQTRSVLYDATFWLLPSVLLPREGLCAPFCFKRKTDEGKNS